MLRFICHKLARFGVFGISLLGLAAPALADDCKTPGFGWSDTKPQVNVEHIFCGELKDGKPKGFHSMQMKSSWTVVKDVTKRRNDRNGIYDADVTFTNDRRKFSTFYPDACTPGQITASILYAASNSTGQHPDWGTLGPSAPASGGSDYCLDSAGKSSEIRFATLRSGGINTAFPN
jgi:hypothetical protein